MRRWAWIALVLAACKGGDEPKETGILTDDSDSPLPSDRDGDGVADDADCAPDDANVYPGAEELCDDRDNNCDGETDEGLLSTFYADGDHDGYGDTNAVISACNQPEGAVTDGGDCDDGDARIHPNADESDCTDPTDYNCDGAVGYADADQDNFPACQDCDDGEAAVHPGATELCDGVDNDCDGDIDGGAADARESYADADEDGYGDPNVSERGCALPEGYVNDSQDCDDGDAAINPSATEVCDEVDNDCDGAIDDEDPSLDSGSASLWYADTDGDGYGDANNSLTACDPGSGYESAADDCDDSDGAVHPGAAEVWYDGTDGDCDGADDFDADADGDLPIDYGGGDCDDSDATRYTNHGCRPAVSCTHPSVSTLSSGAPGSASDVQFTATCDAAIGTQVTGYDRVRVLTSGGSATDATFTSDQRDVGAVVIDPSSGAIYAVFNSTSSVGLVSGSGFSIFATGTFTSGSNWTNFYANWSPSSAAMDSGGCIWIPNFAGSGSIVCVRSNGSASTLSTSLSGYIESLALDSNEQLYVSIGAQIYWVDPSSGSSGTQVNPGATVLDMVFDYNDDLYVETTAGSILMYPGGSGSPTTFATVSGQGKLAISPDGWLVRITPVVNGNSGWEEWELGD